MNLATHPYLNTYIDLSLLDRHGRALSAESFFSSINIPGVFRNLAQQVHETFKSVGEFVALPDIPTFSSDEKKFLKLLSSVNYHSIMDTQAQTPEGLKSTYVQYLHTLVKAAEHASQVQVNVVEPYVQFLTMFAAGNQYSTSGVTQTSVFKKQDGIRKVIYTDLGKHFSKEGYGARVLVKDVVKSNNEWHQVFQGLKQCNEYIQVVDREKVISMVNTCSDLIDVIIKQFSAMSDRKVSKEAAEQLHNYAFNVGKELELYAMIHYRTLALQTAVTGTMGSLNEIFG
jgi:hypothetical protein